MTLDERITDVKRRLDFAADRKVGAQQWHDILVWIVESARQDGIEEERAACAKIAEDYYYSVNPEGYEAACKTVAAREIREKIRARGDSGKGTK